MEIKKNKPNMDITKLRIMVYGPPKIGKSTFATMNPRALILDADNNGTQFLDCFRIPINDWEEMKKMLKDIVDDERFDTIVLDTVDMFWHLCRKYVCKQNGIRHESEDKGFGRIWDFVKTEWMNFIGFFNKANKGVWFVSHAIEKEKKIDGVPRTVVTPTLPGTASRMVMAMCDEIFYIDQDEEGKRKMFLVPQSGIECGGRLSNFGLNKDISFDNEKECYDKIINILKGSKK